MVQKDEKGSIREKVHWFAFAPGWREICTFLQDDSLLPIDKCICFCMGSKPKRCCLDIQAVEIGVIAECNNGV